MVNKAIIVGRLGKDPELRYTPSGVGVVNFSVATSERRKQDDGSRGEVTTWHNIVAWGKTAEICAEYLTKGREVYIEGRIDNRSYDDKEGNKKYISEIVVQNIQFLGGKSSGGDNGGSKASGNDDAPKETESRPEDDLPF